MWVDFQGFLWKNVFNTHFYTFLHIFIHSYTFLYILYIIVIVHKKSKKCGPKTKVGI